MRSLFRSPRWTGPRTALLGRGCGGNDGSRAGSEARCLLRAAAGGRCGARLTCEGIVVTAWGASMQATIDGMAVHYETGAPIPAELWAKVLSRLPRRAPRLRFPLLFPALCRPALCCKSLRSRKPKGLVSRRHRPPGREGRGADARARRGGR